MKIELPMWLKELPNTAILSAKDIHSVFGYKTPSALTNAATRSGAFPMPKAVDRSKFTSCGIAVMNKSKMMWTKAEIITEINRRNSAIGE